MNLNFVNNIIFPSWIEEQNEEEIHTIKKIAQIQGKKLKKYPSPEYILKRSIEISKSTINTDLNAFQKLIFISNSVFPEDENILYIMDFYGWTKEKAEQLNKLIIKIKLLKRKNLDINIDLSLLEEIKHISFVGLGINNPAILINRINELSVTKKDEIKHIKTKKY